MCILVRISIHGNERHNPKRRVASHDGNIRTSVLFAPRIARVRVTRGCFRSSGKLNRDTVSGQSVRALALEKTRRAPDAFYQRSRQGAFSGPGIPQKNYSHRLAPHFILKRGKSLRGRRALDLTPLLIPRDSGGIFLKGFMGVSDVRFVGGFGRFPLICRKRRGGRPDKQRGVRRPIDRGGR